MEDEDIRTALRRGDTEVAFRMLVRLHGPAIYSRCCRILRNRGAAEDVMQQAMLSAFKSRGQLIEVDQIRGWLIRIATRKALDELRASKRLDRLRREMLDTEDGDGEDVIAQFGSTQGRRALEECLSGLASDLRAAVLMRYHDAMSWEQIAEAVALPPDTIRIRVQRGALNSLRECLASKEVAP